jgi:hypothetical protein
MFHDSLLCSGYTIQKRPTADDGYTVVKIIPAFMKREVSSPSSQKLEYGHYLRQFNPIHTLKPVSTFA